MDLGGGDGRNVSRYLLQRLRSINEVLELREQRRREGDEKSPRKDENLATAGTSAGEAGNKR